MKTQNLLIIFFALIKLNSFGQQTPETALRFDSWYLGNTATLTNSSFSSVTPILNYGSLINPYRLAWTYIPVCDSSTIQIDLNGTIPFSDTIGYCVYGPFIDTTNISSQLLTATPVTSRPYNTFPINQIYLTPSPGIYYIAWCINNIASPVSITADHSGPPYYRFCEYCNDPVFIDQSICLITLDSTTQRNSIIFDKGDTSNISGYILFRENSIAGQFDSLAFIHRDSASVFIDLTANPATRNWRYMMHRYDVCGSRLPAYYQGYGYIFRTNTIHLQQGVSTNNSINLSWNNQINNTPFPGSGGFIQSFYIYRSNGVDPYIAIDSIPISLGSYTDVNPNQGLNLYQVTMRKISPCTITRNSEIESRSNVLSTTFTGIYNPVKHNFFKLFPNPAHNEFNVEINEKTNNWSLSLFNLQGQEIKSEENITESKIKVNCDILPAGIYTIRVISSETNYFKKLIIE